ncbi:MAG: winged helix-turn-helix domain-containing protein, partial [Candidatus Omnitrophica bacterium]|nr:winged helix-turn-helix domain-containing protein [Candidatus Omnitrophota bacterium]
MQRSAKLSQEQKKELKAIINNTQSSGREVRRVLAVLLVDEGTEIQTIKTLSQYSRRQIFDLRKNYLSGGIEAIKDKNKGKPKELLTKKQKQEILEIIKTKTPREYEYDWDWWTTAILSDLIERQYKVKYKSKTSVYIIFRQAKFSYHKPGRVYEKRNEEEVAQWKESTKARVEAA